MCGSCVDPASILTGPARFSAGGDAGACPTGSGGPINASDLGLSRENVAHDRVAAATAAVSLRGANFLSADVRAFPGFESAASAQVDLGVVERAADGKVNFKHGFRHVLGTVRAAQDAPAATMTLLSLDPGTRCQARLFITGVKGDGLNSMRQQFRCAQACFETAAAS